MQWTTEDATTYQMQVFDFSGKKVLEQKIFPRQGVNNRELDVSKLANGTYLLKMLNGEDLKTMTFVIRT